MKKQRLELTWVDKDVRPRLEPRILIENAELSYSTTTVGADKIFHHDNILIKGDNLLALKSLNSQFSNKIKCIYIDPPFNTQQAFVNYNDGVEHSLWLSLMRDRIEILHDLLSEDGTIFVHIDDNELAYLTVVMDSIFGRNNRVSIVTFKQGSATGHKSINPGVVSISNFVLIYAKNKSAWKPNRIFTARLTRDKRYGQFITNIDSHHSEWSFITLAAAFARELNLPDKSAKKELGERYEDLLSEFVLKNAKSTIRLARPDYNSVSSAARQMIDISKSQPHVVQKLERDDHSDLYLIGGERILFYSDKLKLIDGQYVAGEPLTSIWDDILSNNLHNEGGVEFPKGKKPEALLKRCIDLSTKPGDLVLDSFAGSGTTGAVAHKMGRRWIMIELGDHADTHIAPRLRRVIDGQDHSGVTEATSWRGGGGFKYYRLAPSLLTKDPYGQWVITDDYRPEMLAEAVCQIMGFNYAPSLDHDTYWLHGYSSDTDFIFVTTRSMTYEALAKLSEEVGDDRTLLVACRAYSADEEAFPNLTLKKIPLAVLAKCEWGRDDYSFQTPDVVEPENQVISEIPDAPMKERLKLKLPNSRTDTPSLFGENE